MRIALWPTEHTIAANVMAACYDGAQDNEAQYWHTSQVTPQRIAHYDTHIAYGILRGTDDVFRECDKQGKPWIHLDKGYFRPGHYDGYYRVSLRGTQQTSDWPEPDYERLEALQLDIKPWRGFDPDKPVLYCVPTQPVVDFFQWRGMKISQDAIDRGGVKVRMKGDPEPIRFEDYNYVHTFNSAVGWQALAAGIPCVSDPEHSIVGSWFSGFSTDKLAEAQHNERMKLFATMSALQLTLEEIRAGKLWKLLSQFKSTSDMTAGSLSAQASLNTASESAPTLQSRFTTSGTGS